jgi:uncharacterized protein (DUF302 family)
MKKILITILFATSLFFTSVASTMEMDRSMMQQMVQLSIQKWKINEGVSIQDAIDSMQLRANLLNFMQVADLPLSEQVRAMGQENVPYMRILAFCDALIANEMVKFDVIFSGFLPCRIAVVEDGEGQGWITTMNMDMMLNAVELSPELEQLATRVRDVIYEIVEAGVTGDF